MCVNEEFSDNKTIQACAVKEGLQSIACLMVTTWMSEWAFSLTPCS